MKLDVDYLIYIMKKHTFKSDSEFELGEQSSPDAAAAGGASTGEGGGGQKNNVTTWSNIVGAKVSRGKANPLGKSGEKWTSGVARTGPANPVERKKWSDVVQVKRDGPANQLT